MPESQGCRFGWSGRDVHNMQWLLTAGLVPGLFRSIGARRDPTCSLAARSCQGESLAPHLFAGAGLHARQTGLPRVLRLLPSQAAVSGCGGAASTHLPGQQLWPAGPCARRRIRAAVSWLPLLWRPLNSAGWRRRCGTLM